jgi:phospholipase C
MKIKVTNTKKGQAIGRHASGTRHTKYVSPATAAVAITAYPSSQSEPSQPTIVVNTTGGAGSPCTNNNDGSKTCTISFQAPTGTDDFAVSAYDQAPVNNQVPSGANLLSAGTDGNVNIVAGQVNTVTISLGGQVASIGFNPTAVLASANGQAQSYPLYIEPLDADGYVIIPLTGSQPYNNGTGQITASVTSGDPLKTITLVPPTASTPNLYTVDYTGAALADAVITASLPGSSVTATGDVTPLNSSVTSLTLTFTSPNQSAPVIAQIAKWTGAITASVSSSTTACSVSPLSGTPASAGAPVTFTVTATNSGTCSLTLSATSVTTGASASLGVPVTVNGTGVGLGFGGKIQHVVLVMEENRSFDNVFGGLDTSGKPFPGADTASNPQSGALVPHDHLGNVVQLQTRKYGDPFCYNPQHDHINQVADIDGGKMDGFDQFAPAIVTPCTSGASPQPAPTDWVYQTLDYPEVSPTWKIAETYALADHHFEAISSASFSEHLILVSGNNGGAINNPSNRAPGWGCDDTTPSITVNLYDPTNPAGDGIPGPFPCFAWPTFADVMSQHGISWNYYAPSGPAQGNENPDFGYQWSALDAFYQDRYGPVWNTNVLTPTTQFLVDIAAGKLAQFTWIAPYLFESDHPRSGSNTAPSYLVSIVNAVGESKFWPTTAVFVLWDDFGGMYDHVPPNPPGSAPQGPGYGLRTGLIAISPWSKRAYVFHSFTTSAMVLKFAEEALGVPSMGGYDTDPNGADLSGMFDFTQTPNFNFTPFQQQYSKSTLKSMEKKKWNGPADTY